MFKADRRKDWHLVRRAAAEVGSQLKRRVLSTAPTAYLHLLVVCSWPGPLSPQSSALKALLLGAAVKCKGHRVKANEGECGDTGAGRA